MRLSDVNFLMSKAVVDIKPPGRLRPFQCELSDLRSFKMSTKDNCPHVILMQRDGTTHPALHFKTGGINGFLETIGKFKCIRE